MADTVQDYTKKWCAPICLDVTCTYTTQRKHQTKGMYICPHTFGCPHMFGCPPVCLDAPICLEAPVCLGAPYV